MHNEEIIIKNASHTVTEEETGSNESLYRLSYRVNDAFREGKSHAAEVMMLCTYAPDEEYGSEDGMPYIAVQCDDPVYCAAEQYKETGSFEGALDIVPLSGRFLFMARMRYYEYMMYFYAFDRCGGYWENNGLCLVYPEEYAGTENEKKLMSILDEAAESYREELISKGSSVPADPVTSPSGAAGSSVMKTVSETASVIRKVRFWAKIALLIGILAFLAFGRIRDHFSVHHLVQLRGDEEIISEFTPEEEQKVLDAFDVKIPANETGARLSSFMHKRMNEKVSSYVIEIDGVEDYDAFFRANSGRSLGQSVNEADTRQNKKKYFITYNEHFADDEEYRRKHDISGADAEIEKLFSELSSGT